MPMLNFDAARFLRIQSGALALGPRIDEPGVSVILLKGEDAYRDLADRVEAFAARYTDKLFVLDTASFDLPGISPSARGLLSPGVLATALERLSAHLEARRNHPLSTRRYYKRVDY